MQNYVFRNIIGSFVFDKGLNFVKEDANAKGAEPKDAELIRVLTYLKQPRFFKRFYEANLKITKAKIKDSVNEDQLVIQAVSSINEIEKVSNLLTRRLREWYSYYNPEFSGSIENNEKFVELILKKDKNTLLKEINVNDSMGADFKKDDLKPMNDQALQIIEVNKLKEKQNNYLEKLLSKYCPNITAICPVSIAALLLKQAGSLKRMAMLPASTIQLLGAEKALFRHLRNKKNAAPKYGYLHEHPLVAKSNNKGKTARVLADKISIAARIDYFKGKFMGDRLKKQIEAKIK